MADIISRDETTIGNSMLDAIIAQTLDVSDLSPASTISIILRGGVAPELALLHIGAVVVAQSGYVSTATGEALDRLLAEYGLTRPAAAASFGRVTFTRMLEANGAPGGTDDEDVVIPEGYTVTATDFETGDDITFTVRADITIPAGDLTASGMVDAETAGSAGNVASGAIDTLDGGDIDGLESVTNERAFTPGRDAAGDEAARDLFWSWLRRRTPYTPQGLPEAAMVYEEEDADGTLRRVVGSAAIVEHFDAVGADGQAVTLYVSGVSGDDLTDDQVVGIQEYVDGYTDTNGDEVEGQRAAGIKVHVTRPATVEVDVTVNLTLSGTGTASTRARLRRDVEIYLNSLPAENGNGSGTATVKAVYDAVCRLGGEVANVGIITPVEDVLVGIGQKIVAGTVTIN